MIQSNDMLGVSDVTDILSVKLLGVIPEDENIIISTNRGEPIVNMENTKAGMAYMNIARRIMVKKSKSLILKHHRQLSLKK